MDNYEDDDDTHYCIKCHLTVNGLENYIRHRQTGCRTTDPKNDITNENLPIPTTVSYPESSANFFFNSLELQSSTKTKSTCNERINTELEKKLSTKNEDKRINKKNKKYNDDITNDKLDTLPPVVADLDDLTDHIGIPSLVGFPDIVTFNDNKTPTTKFSGIILKQNEKKRNDDHHRVWLDDTFEDLDVNKEETVTDNYHDEYTGLSVYQDDDTDDESSDDDVQESYSDTDEQDDQEYPPRGHIGGKWKPGQLLHDITPQNDDELEDDRPESPPRHTGGKWKPTEKIDEDEQHHHHQQQQQQQLEGEYDDDQYNKETVMLQSRQPPPGHTRGKWIPGATIGPTETNVTCNGYWCSPCGRRLASKLLYNRHLRSDLHARRSIQEIEGDVKLPKSIGPLLRRKCRSKRQRAIELKNETQKNMSIVDKPTKTKRQREKIVLKCEMCHARVRRPQLGKHLLSHYHCRIAGLNPCSSAARNFILENMDNVVRQCPFQCSICRFYCNTEDTFLLHWRSKLHCDAQNNNGGHYTCTCCEFWCESNELMENHLLSLEHRNAVTMINGSVPIVIGRHRILTCDTCCRNFRYNFQLRIHAKETGHAVGFTASDDYQQKVSCNICQQVFHSLVALQRHQLSTHISDNNTKEQKTAPYFCSFCSMNFETSHDAVIHRRTQSHKQTVKEHKLPIGGSLEKNCGHCGETLANLRLYKRHLLQHHRDLCHRCPRCGMVFALPQDVTKHTKHFECQPQQDQSFSNNQKWKCPICPFSVDSQAEYLFHQSLHTGVIQPDPQQPSSSTTTPKYSCPLCKKLYPKGTLSDHIRRHTGEKPFSCSKCYQSFFTRSRLSVHEKNCLMKDMMSSKSQKERYRNYVCLECNAAFYTKHSLRQHMLRHAGKSYKCQYPGCPTILRTENELTTHRTLVHENIGIEKKYQCDECLYAGKTKTQLRRHQECHKVPSVEGHFKCHYDECTFVAKTTSHLQRHIRIHTGKKPYKCRHCKYASNNLENLRKHVLSTRLHPGKMIYECDTCRKNNIADIFCTNFSKELRSHLVESHQQEFPTANHALTYVSQLFNDHN